MRLAPLRRIHQAQEFGLGWVGAGVAAFVVGRELEEGEGVRTQLSAEDLLLILDERAKTSHVNDARSLLRPPSPYAGIR